MDNGFVDFGPDKSPLNQLITLSSLDPRTDPVNNATLVTSSWPQELTCVDDGDSKTFNYTMLTHSNPGGQNYSSLLAGALIGLECPSVMNSSWAQVFGCTLDAAWSQYQVNSTANAQVADSYSLSKRTQPNITVEFAPDFVMRMISLYMSGINNTNINVYVTPLLTVAMANSLPFAKTLQQQGSLLFHDSTNPATSDYFTQQQINAARSWINKNKLLSRFSSVEIFGLNNWTDPGTLDQLDLKTFRAEYGYDSTSIPVRLALVVFALYVLVTASHVTYTLVTGESGTSWDSVADLVMLALNSRKPPEVVGSTSVGLDSITTFRELVNIRINETTNAAELVFDKDASSDDGTLTRARTNVAY